jgi:hypothetical protein
VPEDVDVADVIFTTIFAEVIGYYKVIAAEILPASFWKPGGLG